MYRTAEELRDKKKAHSSIDRLTISLTSGSEQRADPQFSSESAGLEIIPWKVPTIDYDL